MKKEKTLIAEILKFIRFLIIVILIAGLAIFFYRRIKTPADPELTESFVSGRLETVSELTTSRLFYTGLIKYTEGNIPFLTQNSFSMVYTAELSAGIDLSQAQVTVTDEQVEIILPKSQIQSVEIDPDSIEFYDERFSLFNWSKKEDVTDTISAARSDVEQKADVESLLENSNEQAHTLIQGLFADSIGDRKLVITTDSGQQKQTE